MDFQGNNMEKNELEIGTEVIFLEQGNSDYNEFIRPGITKGFIIAIAGEDEFGNSVDPNNPNQSIKVRWRIDDSQKDKWKQVLSYTQIMSAKNFDFDWWVYRQSLGIADPEYMKLTTPEERHKYMICKKIKELDKRRKDQGYAF